MKRNELLNTQEKDLTNTNLRPQRLRDFIGQTNLLKNLTIFIEAAKNRSEALDHILLHGPPGLGKTTLGHIIARELNVNFHASSGPLLNKAGDLAAILTNLHEYDILFIDEIHRLNHAIEEILYSALEDYYLDIIMGSGPGARTIRIDIAPFTLIGATTRLGLLSNPLRDRFGIPLRLEFYTTEELISLLQRAAKILALFLTLKGATVIAQSSRGTPRVALRLLRRIRDFAEIQHITQINDTVVREILCTLEIDHIGLDRLDYEYLRFIAQNYYPQPVGIETIAAALTEKSSSIEEIIEPYLIQIGFIQKTSRGRLLTAKGMDHLYKKISDNK